MRPQQQQQQGSVAKFLQTSADLYPDIPIVKFLNQVINLAMESVRADTPEENPHVLAKIGASWKQAMEKELFDVMKFREGVEKDHTAPSGPSTPGFPLIESESVDCSVNANDPNAMKEVEQDSWEEWEDAGTMDIAQIDKFVSMKAAKEEVDDTKDHFEGVSDIENEEPVAQDLLLCQIEVVTRPTKKKSQISGWECSGTQGHLRVRIQLSLYSSS